MIWFAFAVLSLALLSPIVWAQRGKAFRSRRQAALAFYRAQLGEVAEEGSRGRLGGREQAEARLEIERRLLAAGSLAEDRVSARTGFSWRLTALIAVLPILAFIFYLPQGEPLLPAAPLAPRIAAAEARLQQDQAMLALLQSKIATLDPHSEEARHGYILLGKLDADLGDAAGAAAAWSKALAIRFDPKLAQLAAMAEAVAKKAMPGKPATSPASN
ncbi:MAG TPA: c-type cytochrome biogenesis protein CcmI [Acidisoma sp.]|jgi:cytochrome c-type biogenesis protein CcmH|nr:c-type cytochrome biogenesis protein CcmI [Acidisoma sp.]